MKQFAINVSGFTDGLNTDTSVLKALPSEMMDGTKNIELLSNGSVRPRRGLELLGTNELGEFFTTLDVSEEDNQFQLAPNIIFARLSSPAGTQINLVVEFINNKFNIYDAAQSSMTSAVPKQVIEPVFMHEKQKFFNIDMKASHNKIFFAGKHIHPGYLEVVNSDTQALAIKHYEVIVRRKVNTGAGVRIQHNGVGYECIEEHDPKNFQSDQSEPGVGDNWRRWWQVLENYSPVDLPTWKATDPVYVTSFYKQYTTLTPPDGITTYPTCVELFAGRIWLGGDPQFPNTLYFTQVIQSDDYYHRFHTFADPFDTDDPDVVASDGGTIETPECGLVHQLVAEDDALHYGASNKVFYISGVDGGFAANSFVNKESVNEGILGYGNMVRADDSVLVFAESNIYRSERERSSYRNQIIFDNVTSGRLNKFYSKISPFSKAAAKAVYNPSDKKIYWFYADIDDSYYSTYGANKQHGYFTECLVFDTNKPVIEGEFRKTTGLTFTYFSYPRGSREGFPFIACPFVCLGLGGFEQNVVVELSSGVQEHVKVLDQDVVLFNDYKETRPQEMMASVLIPASSASSATTVRVDKFKVFSDDLEVVTDYEDSTQVFTQKSFARLIGDKPYDWEGTEYESAFDAKLYAGLQTGGSILATKTQKYLFLVFKRVERGFVGTDKQDVNPGGCLVYTASQFATGPGTGKWVGPYQVYFPDRWAYTNFGDSNPDMSHVWFKHKVRGRGNVHQVVFSNDGKKDFHLVGWAQSYTASL